MWIACFNADERRALYTPQFAAEVATGQRGDEVRLAYEQSDATTLVERLLDVDTQTFLPDQFPAISTFQIAVIMYSGKFIKERPKVARDFLQAYAKGVRYYTEQGGAKHPEMAAILAKHTQVPAEVIKAAIPFYIDPAVRPRVQDLATLQDFFVKMGWVKQPVPMDRVVDLSFLE